MNLDDENFELLAAACCSIQDFMIPFHTMCLFWPRQKNIWGQLPLDVSTGSAVQVLSEPMGKQKVPRVRWCWPNNQRFRIDSTIVLRCFAIFPDKLKLLYRWMWFRWSCKEIHWNTKRYPRQIQSWRRTTFDNFVFSRSSTTERPRECVFFGSACTPMGNDWLEARRHRNVEKPFFFCWGRMVSSQTIIVLSQKFQWFCSLGFECWYMLILNSC